MVRRVSSWSSSTFMGSRHTITPALRPNQCFITFVFLLRIMSYLVLNHPMFAQTSSSQIELPKSIDVWSRPDTAHVVVKKNIFEYMDGAGELYLGYRFDHLEVYEYTAPDQYSILVELYWMKCSDDAFGLLSLDWGGESVALSDEPKTHPSPLTVPDSRALYGAGLLRLCSGDLYARVMAYQETLASKNAVLQLGKAIMAGRRTAAAPHLMTAVPSSATNGWHLSPERVSYFRNHLVLNSLYYLSSENSLDLDLSTEAVFAGYADPTDRSRSIKLLVCRYPESNKAEKALSHFRTVYLPESRVKATRSNCFRIEDGWTGFARQENSLILVFEASDETVVQSILEKVKVNLSKLEGQP